MEIILRIIAILFLLLVISACDSSDCNLEIASDQVRHADTIDYNSVTYHLYTRTTGWQDKIVFFELYDKKPEFDHCGSSAIEPIFVINYDDYPEMKYVKELILQPEQTEKLKIIYTKNKNEGTMDVYNVKFSR